MPKPPTGELTRNPQGGHTVGAVPGLPRWTIGGLGAIVFGGVVFYTFLALARWDKAPTWGAIGDAVGPFVALLNAGALLALLFSIGLQREALREQRRELKLQRRELRLQRKEFRENRAVMQEQRTQFERTASAQETLGQAQALAAIATSRSALTAAAVKILELERESSRNDPDHLRRLSEQVNVNTSALDAVIDLAVHLLEKLGLGIDKDADHA